MERQLDVRFLVLIIQTLEKNDIMMQLPTLIRSLDGSDSQSKLVKTVFLKLVEARDEGEGALIAPSELIIRIHNLEDQIGLQNVMLATNICFEAPEVFKQEVFAVVLQQLLDQVKLPTLLMRTMIQSVLRD